VVCEFNVTEFCAYHIRHYLLEALKASSAGGTRSAFVTYALLTSASDTESDFNIDKPGIQEDFYIGKAEAAAPYLPSLSSFVNFTEFRYLR
jgi:hypothetical protein